MTDKTGNRRWYPIKVNSSGYDLYNNEREIKADIVQAWAEAKFMYDKGELLPYADVSLLKEIKQEQSKAVEDDYRVGLIESYLDGQQEVCILELWVKALHNGEFSKPTKKDSIEIGLIMQGFTNWEKQEKAKRFDEFGLQRWWKRKDEYEKLDGDLPF